jgi:hypothetical protein
MEAAGLINYFPYLSQGLPRRGGFWLRPLIAEVDPRADYLRGVTSRLEGVNPEETREWATLQERQSL